MAGETKTPAEYNAQQAENSLNAVFTTRWAEDPVVAQIMASVAAAYASLAVYEKLREARP